MTLGWTALIWLWLTLASAWVTHIVTDSHWPPVKWFRDEVRLRFGPTSGWFTWITCAWCIGVGLTAAVFAWAWWLMGIPYPLLQLTAALFVVGGLGMRFTDD